MSIADQAKGQANVFPVSDMISSEANAPKITKPNDHISVKAGNTAPPVGSGLSQSGLPVAVRSNSDLHLWYEDGRHIIVEGFYIPNVDTPNEVQLANGDWIIHKPFDSDGDDEADLIYITAEGETTLLALSEGLTELYTIAQAGSTVTTTMTTDTGTTTQQ